MIMGAFFAEELWLPFSISTDSIGYQRIACLLSNYVLLTLAPAPLTACQVPALLNATRSAVEVASSPEVQSRVRTVAGVGAQVADGVGMTASQVKVQVSTSC